jgi:hypothetical protein
MQDVLVDLSAFQQRFGGDTSPIQTNASQIFFFYKRNFKA